MITEYLLKYSVFSLRLIAMKLRLEQLAIVLVVTMLLIGSASSLGVKIVFSEDSAGYTIDIFTQKEPYSGKGQNAQSDAFAPGEQVDLYAEVLYNGVPIENLLVAFEILGPPNSYENVSLHRSAFTNISGIATTNFRISHLNETTFGLWKAIANARLGDVVAQDSVTFKVGWIVEIMSLVTMNENLVAQDKFARGTNVVVEIVLKNIAMVKKTTTLTVTLYDNLNVRINSTELSDVVVQPNEVPLYVHLSLYIPENVTVGTAVACADAYTAPVGLGGVPYCPEVSAYFLIIEHDIAVLSVKTSSTEVFEGDEVFIDVIVGNLGEEAESFDVSVFSNATLINKRAIADLQPFSNVTISSTWNTTSFPVGAYVISASASAVPGEIDLSDNSLTDGVVNVISGAPPIHDVAVLSVVPSSTSVYVGDPVNIEVRVKNLGNYAEFFNVTVFYDSHIVGTVLVGNLLPDDERLLTFGWDTQGVAPNTYTLKAWANLPTDENTGNNQYIDGTVEVKTGPPPPPPVHDIAVVSVIPDATFVTVGDSFNINVTVKNNGTEAESFSIFLYYNGTENAVAPSISVTNLAAGTETTVIFSWNTSNFLPNNYTLVGYAQPVQDEVNTVDNALTDGTIKLVASTRGLLTFDLFWLWLLIILLLLLLIILIIFMLYRRRKKKKNQGDQTFMSGWIAWYYRHDLQEKRHKT
jgi:hypothetical protein